MYTHSIRQGRSIHLIDIENQLGTPFIEATAIHAWFQDYSFLTNYQVGDQMVMATSTGHTLVEVERSGVSCRKDFRPGTDGADLVLQTVMREEHLVERFDRIVCASGDGGFTEVVAALGSLGAYVVVASRSSCLAKRLRMAASEVIILPEHQPDTAYPARMAA